LCSQAEAKRSAQLLVRNLLDQQVQDRQQRSRQLAQEEEADDAQRVADANKAQEDKEAYGCERLVAKYVTVKMHVSVVLAYPKAAACS
jgi:hypothetical protein